MCNSRHPDSKILKNESGVGFKIFRFVEGIYYPMIARFEKYAKAENGWIYWNRKYKTKAFDVGFCVFVIKEEAIECLEKWSVGYRSENYILRRVQYAQAIYEHSESQIIGGLISCVRLVKQFKILED